MSGGRLTTRVAALERRQPVPLAIVPPTCWSTWVALADRGICREPGASVRAHVQARKARTWEQTIDDAEAAGKEQQMAAIVYAATQQPADWLNAVATLAHLVAAWDLVYHARIRAAIFLPDGRRALHAETAAALGVDAATPEAEVQRLMGWRLNGLGAPVRAALDAGALASVP